MYIKKITILLILHILGFNSFCQDSKGITTFYDLRYVLNNYEKYKIINILDDSISLNNKVINAIEVCVDFDNLELIQKYPLLELLVFHDNFCFNKGNYKLNEELNNLKLLKYLDFWNMKDIKINFDNKLHFDSLIYMNFGIFSPTCDNLPDFIYNQSSLVILSGIFQNYKSVNNNIRNLNHLQLLNLSFRKLKKIPDGINDLHELKKLTLYSDRCNIKNLDTGVSKLENLEYLMLSINLSEKSISIISKLRNLKVLKINNINNNSIKDLEKLNFLDEIIFEEINNEKKKEKIIKILPNTKIKFN